MKNFFLTSFNVMKFTLTSQNIFSNSFMTSKRYINLHEYQSKRILKRFGLNVQRGDVATTAHEAYLVAKNLKDNGARDLIVKSQILAGGRGKGTLSSGLKGGIKICSTPEEVKQVTEQMIGYNLVTNQTKKEGERVDRVLILDGVDIKKELYLAIVLDPSVGGPVIVASQQGGMDIEEVAAKYPEAVFKLPLEDPQQISRDECLKVAMALGLANGEQAYPLNVSDQIIRLFDLYLKTDATTVEINPLAMTTQCDDHLVCVDAKLNFDDNAAYRQSEIMNMEDTSTRDPREFEAQQSGLSFITMTGNIGCLVNGAGLAMATMDIVQLHGGSPANFLDVGGGATADQVTHAFNIIKKDEKTKLVFVNIFGGIMRCDIIAEGLVTAVKTTDLKLPLVIRLIGNRMNEGKDILRRSSIQCHVIDDLEMAAKTACQLAIQ